jgi:hypothetical protein
MPVVALAVKGSESSLHGSGAGAKRRTSAIHRGNARGGGQARETGSFAAFAAPAVAALRARRAQDLAIANARQRRPAAAEVGRSRVRPDQNDTDLWQQRHDPAPLLCRDLQVAMTCRNAWRDCVQPVADHPAPSAIVACRVAAAGEPPDEPCLSPSCPAG